MNKIARTGILLLIFALTLNITAASPVDLDIFPKESSTRADSFTTYEVTVTNEGPVEDVYDITSSNPSEVTVAPRQVPEDGTLEPGESQTVQVWFNPDLDRPEGTYTFSINAESQATGETYSVDGIVEVIKEHEVEVGVEGPGPVCRGDEAVYEVTVTNEGTQSEEFRIKPDAGYLSQETVSLESGETKTVQLTRSSNLAVEDRSFNIKVKSTSSYAKDTTSTSFIVEQCYESDASMTPENQRTAALTQAEYQVTVSNEGTRSDEFVLSSNYGELSETELSIASGDSQSVALTYTPEQVQDRTLTVTAEGRSTSQASANLDVYNGQNMTVEFGEESTKTCENTEFAKQVRVENTGEAVETYKLSTSKGALEETELELVPGEEATLSIGFNSSDYKIGSTQQVRVSAQATTFSEPKKAVTSSFKVENCYDLKMDVVPQVASAGENRSILYEINLENTGTQRNEYRVTGSGPGWISVEPSQLTVDAGQTGKSYIYAGIPYKQANGTVEITAVAEGEQIRKTQTVNLVIGEEEKDAIKSDKGGGITGYFSKSLSDSVKAISESSSLVKIGLSILVGLVISAVILAREW